MSLPIHVDAYSFYKANERPQQFTLDEEIYEIAAVLDQWYEPSAMYFKVRSTEGKTYLLRYDEAVDEWTLQSGFDGDDLLARPSIELVTVDPATAKKAEQQIESCEHCHPADAEIPFDWLLAEVTDISVQREPTRHFITYELDGATFKKSNAGAVVSLLFSFR